MTLWTPSAASATAIGRHVQPARRSTARAVESFIHIRPFATLSGCFIVLAMVLPLFALSPAGAQSGVQQVLLARVEGAITPVIADYLSDGVAQAERGRYAAFVVELDTPGGLDTSMREIVQRFTSAAVPVAVYVSPQGARAASAGAIITFAAHVAAMAPATAIGAATPVSLEGGDLDRKIINDAAAYAESIAKLRGRNVEFAIQTVREGRSAGADEALEIGAVDLIAGSVEELLEKIHGREVSVAGGTRVSIQSRGATTETFELDLFRRIRQLLANPNLAFLFMSLGTLALIYELASPGIGAGGIVGAIFLILGLFALSVLPVNVAGLVLLLVAAALFAAELFAPGVGIAAAGGAIALLLSGIFLFRQTPGIGVSMAVLVPVTVVVAGGVVGAGRLVVRSQRARSTMTGEEQYVGRVLTVGRSDGNRGQVLVDGAWWTARSQGHELQKGDEVRVIGYEGLDLLVERIHPARQSDADAGASEP